MRIYHWHLLLNNSEWKAFAIGVDADVVKNPDLRRGIEDRINNRDNNR